MIETQKTTPMLQRLIPRVIVTIVALGIWFWTQSLIDSRPATHGEIGDGLHRITATANAYFQMHPNAANVLLIVSSGLIDALAIFLLWNWLVGRTIRPFLGLLILLGLRQIVQTLCALPTPPGMIWHYPGFPSLLVTYSVAGDFFFSGHTAITVFGAVELSRFGKRWLTIAAVLIAMFEIATVIILRAHYTMDVFAGIVAALWVAALVAKISPRLDRALLGKG